MPAKIIHKKLAYDIVGCAMEVHRELGGGFLEKVYENSLLISLKNAGLAAEPQVPLSVYFQNVEVGHYIADIIVENKIILELKAVQSITDRHRAQTINYLKATKLRLALLLNFSHSLQHERFIN